MKSNYAFGAFRDVRFLLVCDVVYIIDIRNLVNVAHTGLFYVLVGREIDILVIEIVGVFS